MAVFKLNGKRHRVRYTSDFGGLGHNPAEDIAGIRKAVSEYLADIILQRPIDSLLRTSMRNPNSPFFNAR